MTFSVETHVQRIEESLTELSTFQPRTAEPAHVAHQYVGTVVDNSLALLVIAANALDGRSRNVSFSESRNWISLLQAVHRSFFASLHLAVERGLHDICEKVGSEVSSSAATQFDREYKKLFAVLETDVAIEQAKRFRNKCRPRTHPTFDDYLNVVLKLPNLALSREIQQTWRSFFRALSIVRNKASHSNPSLTNKEMDDLAKSGCSVMVSADDTLVLNARMYFQLVDHVLNFLDVVTESGEGVISEAHCTK